MPRYSVETGLSAAEAIEGIFQICFPDAESILDTTYGNGAFWKGSTRTVTGYDLDPSRDPSGTGVDCRAVPVADQSYDVVVFDPPYLTNVGRGKPSVMGTRFGAVDSLPALEALVREGTAEAWRIARLGIIVKIQDHIRASQLVLMSRWVMESVPVPPYEMLHVVQRQKIVGANWGEQLSFYRNHATYLVFRRGSQRHVRRTRKQQGAA